MNPAKHALRFGIFRGGEGRGRIRKNGVLNKNWTI